ncbi:MAG: uridine kinase [Flammeovirgaceae bacterium]
MNYTPFFVGITGGSGSGKTYFLEELVSKIGEQYVCLVSQDNYYRPLQEQQKDDNGIENFDIPESIDFELFTNHIRLLKSGQEVQKQEYTFNNPNKKPQTFVFKPLPIIVIEGIFVMHYPEIAKMIDLKLFIDAKPHIKIRRRIMRDNVERGYSLEDVLYRYEHHVMPSYEKYILVHKDEADIIIPNNKDFKKALDVVSTYLKSKILKNL